MSEDVAYLKEISRLMSPFLRLNREGLYRFSETEDASKQTALYEFECLGGGTYQVPDPDRAIWNGYIWEVAYRRRESRWYELVAEEEASPLEIGLIQGDLQTMTAWLEGRFSEWRTRHPFWSVPDERIIIEKARTVEESMRRVPLQGPTLEMIEHLATFSMLWELELPHHRIDDDILKFQKLKDLLCWLGGIRGQYRKAIRSSVHTSASLVA